MINKQFKNALLTKEKEEKIFELSTRMGIGNYLAGDRAVKLLESLDAIPEATSISAKTKLHKQSKAEFLKQKKSLKI